MDLFNLIVAVGWRAVEVFDKNPIRFAQVDVNRNQSIQEKKSENPTWKRLKETREYKLLVETVKKNTKRSDVSVEDLLLLYAHEVIREYAEPPKEEKADGIQKELGHVRPPRDVIERGIKYKAAVLMDDFCEQPCVFEAVAPLINLDCEEMHVDLGRSGRIRSLRYSEKDMYNPRYPSAVISYGPTSAHFLLEMRCSMKTEFMSPEIHQQYIQTAGNVVMGIRLLFGGEAGLEYIAANNHVGRMSFGEGTGRVLSWHRFSTRAGPVLVYGEGRSIIKQRLESDLKRIVEALENLQPEFVWRAVWRFGRVSRSDESIDDRVVDLTICFESLFGPEREIAVMRAATLSTLTNKKQPIHSMVEEILLPCWRARDAFAHGHGSEEAVARAKGDLVSIVDRGLEVLRRCLLIAASMNPTDHEVFWSSIDLASESDTNKAILVHIPDWMVLTLQKLGSLRV